MATLIKSTLTSLLFFFLISNVQSKVIFKYRNQCPHYVWLASRPANGLRHFELAPDAIKMFTMPDQWVGSIWVRTKCSLDTGKFVCETGDCGTGAIPCQGPPPKVPVTLVNFQIAESIVSYEVSLVHGFNVQIRVEPSGGNIVEGGSGPCPVVECTRNIGDVCPADLVAYNANGAYVGCNSACDVLNNCQPSYYYTKRFKELCPTAHVFPGDNSPMVHKCGGAKSYNITFCPVH